MTIQGYPKHEWVRPTEEEKARGIIVWYVRINSPFYDKQGNPDVQPTPYNARMIQRRIKRGGELPYWITPVQPLDKVAIVGSRNYPDRQHVIDYVHGLPDNAVIVSGGAKGVDSWAENAAKARGMETIIFPAEWDKYGKSAGFRRNADIVNACNRLVAFWSRNNRGVWSKGTKHSIDLARKQGKRVEIVLAGTDYLDAPDEYVAIARVA